MAIVLGFGRVAQHLNRMNPPQQQRLKVVRMYAEPQGLLIRRASAKPLGNNQRVTVPAGGDRLRCPYPVRRPVTVQAECRGLWKNHCSAIDALANSHQSRGKLENEPEMSRWKSLFFS
ncbi:hypothetical protein M407DRAFT_151733 [Tulasnella calospora MUT 4182]|uniref:Uncharacterized protein n=1 Tax=Tulasnella calospora MUT 4182 TaxID=1051891 RepID=A0A0C3MKH0_9AGAM|nr:hypothetical protein M407DRAFT_151733 [Tulasnella calospora MUT 4182]